MIYDKQALTDLVENIEAGNWPGSDMHDRLGSDRRGELAYDAFYGSLDAARALHEAVLTGWAFELLHRPFGVKPHLWFARLTTDYTGWGNGNYVTAKSDNPARAWLIAIIKALIAKQE